jgi:hypothetical protein
MGDWPIKLRLTQNLFDKGQFFRDVELKQLEMSVLEKYGN